MRNARLPAWLTILTLFLGLFATPCLAGEDYERWFAVELAKNRAGWMLQSQKTEGDLITSTSKMEFSLARDQSGAKITMEGRFVETKSGKPVSMTSIIKFGAQPTTMNAKFGEKEIEVSLTQGGRTETTTRPLPEGIWLTPAAAGDFIKQRLAANAETITVRTLEPLGGGMDPLSALRPVTIERSGFAPTEFDFAGKKIKATKCITTTSSQPNIKSTEVVDEQGIPLSTEANMGVMTIVMRAVDKADARAAHKAPELMVSTFIKPDKAIKNPRAAKQAVYVLSVAEGSVPTVPATGSQRIEPIDAKSVRVTVDAAAPSPASDADLASDLFTACPTTLNCNDPEIKKLAAEATANAGDSKSARAEAIRTFVYTHISKKDLDVGFATASEVARTKQGDCTEHGVLTAALLRASGIPSRVAAGLVYADQFAGGRDIFAYHMWAQALLDVNGKPTWVDLDGTLAAGRSFDATHIALAVSPLAEGENQESFTTIALMLGRLKIAVEKAE